MTQPPGWGDAPLWGSPPPPPQYPGYGQPPPGSGEGEPPRRPRPGIIPLRPLSLGEIFDGAFQAIRTNPRTMLGFSALVLVIITLLSIVPQAIIYVRLGDALNLEQKTDPSLSDVIGYVVGALEAAAIPAVLEAVAVTLLTALLVVAVSGAVLGEQMSPGALWTRVRGRLWALFGLSILVPLTVGLLILVMLTVAVLAAAALGNAVGLTIAGVFGVGCLPLAVYLFYRWSLAGPILLLEKVGIIASLRRSGRLVRGSWWRVFGILLLTAIIVSIGSRIVSAPFAYGGGLLVGNGTSSGQVSTTSLGLLITGVGQIVAGTVFYPFSAAVAALLYIDLRMRREGLDVELMRATGAPEL